jgi:hypothetical protein
MVKEGRRPLNRKVHGPEIVSCVRSSVWLIVCPVLGSRSQRDIVQTLRDPDDRLIFDK